MTKSSDTSGLVVLIALSLSFTRPYIGNAGETLYNGVVLPDRWPPRYTEYTREPMPVPYLDNRPEVIVIDVGRQLFVDDFLIDQTNLQRVYHLRSARPY